MGGIEAYMPRFPDTKDKSPLLSFSVMPMRDQSSSAGMQRAKSDYGGRVGKIR